MLASASSPLLGIQGVCNKQVLHVWRQILHEHQEAAARVCPTVKLNCDNPSRLTRNYQTQV